MPVNVRVLIVESAEDWRTILPATVAVFGSIEYASIYERHTGYSARLFVVESTDGRMAYPFFLRPISDLPFADQVPAARWDILTPEFTGPIGHGVISPELAHYFFDEFAAFCRREAIVAEFAHLHPWSSQMDALDSARVVFNREIVYVNVTVPEAEMWTTSFTYMCRKNINRTRQENVRVFAARTPDDVQEFYRIYVQTMDRRQARANYYFPLDYFVAFFEQMPEYARFVLAEYQGQIVASTLYLHDGEDVYSYLGGADHSFQHVRPTNAVIYDTIGWARAQGKRRLILGGGYQPNDGIFKFKASFSPLRAQFNVYKHIHAPDEYCALTRAWAEYYHQDIAQDDYFPLYRNTPVGEQTKP